MRGVLLVLFALLTTKVCCQIEQKHQLFEAEALLDSPYGICAHITSWNDDGYRYRTRILDTVETLGVDYVRADMYGYMFWKGKDKAVDCRYFDLLVKSLENRKLFFLPILDGVLLGRKAWDCFDEYMMYVDSLVTHYPQFEYWEVINEVDLLKSGYTVEETVEKYVAILDSVSNIIHKRGKKVLLSGVAGVNEEFNSLVLEKGGWKYVDVLNFHYYPNGLAPEMAFDEVYKPFSDRLRALGVNKEIWCTETGYHTEKSKNQRSQFYRNILPKALEDLGIRKGRGIGLVTDNKFHYRFDKEQQIEYLSSLGYDTYYIHYDDIADLDISECPAIIPSLSESFPVRYYDSLYFYVQKGGTCILPFGTPFYYEDTSKGLKEIGEGYRNRLHMYAELWWSSSFVNTGLPKYPTEMAKGNGYENVEYNWKTNYDGTVRYMSEAKLVEDDTLLSIIEVGDSLHKKPICGIYKLGSDLKGNIIFNTSVRDEDGGDVTEQLQSKRIARSYINAFATGISKLFLYELRNGGYDSTSREHNFGILGYDFSHKPSFDAYKFLIQMMPSGSTRPVVTHDIVTGMYLASWVRPDSRKVEAYWNPYDSQEYTIKQRRRDKVYDYLGKELQVKNGQLNVGNGVTFVVRG